MKSKVKLLLSSLLVVLYACDKKDSSCPDTIFVGRFDPSEQALSTLPYQDNTAVVFLDSLGELMEFQASEDDYQLLNWSLPGRCPANYYQEVEFRQDGGMKRMVLENDAASLLLEIAVLSLMDYDTHMVYDELFVSVGVADTIFHQVFNLPVDHRQLSETDFERRMQHIDFEDSITIFGRVFRDVYHDKSFDHDFPFKTYYNVEKGIVSFKDNTGKRWVFEGVK